MREGNFTPTNGGYNNWKNLGEYGVLMLHNAESSIEFLSVKVWIKTD